MDDVRESVEELRYYRKAVFLPPGAPPGTGGTPEAPPA